MKKFNCPRCQEDSKDFPAISRRDNKTEICSQCGVDEAMADYFGKEDNWLDKAETESSERP
jgi:transcription elongation factor Elf1